MRSFLFFAPHVPRARSPRNFSISLFHFLRLHRHRLRLASSLVLCMRSDRPESVVPSTHFLFLSLSQSVSNRIEKLKSQKNQKNQMINDIQSIRSDRYTIYVTNKYFLHISLSLSLSLVAFLCDENMFRVNFDSSVANSSNSSYDSHLTICVRRPYTKRNYTLRTSQVDMILSSLRILSLDAHTHTQTHNP